MSDSLSIGPLVLLQPLWLLATLVLMILASYWNNTQKANDWQSVMSPEVFQFLGGDSTQGDSLKAKDTNWLLWAASLVALCLTQPVIRKADDETWRHSIGWIAVMDLSRSMTLSDTVPSRLSAARQSLSVLSAQSGARPIALIIYAGDAFLVAPPAFDKSVFNEHAALMEHGIIESEGSSLARALSLATSIVADSGFVASRLFVLTDTGGINTSAITAAGYLADNGHKLDVLVFGSEDSHNQQSPTSVSSALARDLASAGHGSVVFADGFGKLDYSQLSLSDESSASTHADLKALVWKDQSHWLLLLGLPLLIIQFRRESH
ncbi:MAG: VWA domain-containing protein [Granulosicoccus sp.]